MSTLKIHIENEKSASLEVGDSRNDFGVYPRSKYDFSVGFEANPLFEINHSLVNERWFFEVMPGGRHIPQQDIAFDDPAGRWLRDSCCSDFSIFDSLPDGKYRLVKTGRKTRFENEILYGNEWDRAPSNIRAFDGISEKDGMLAGTSDKSIGKQKYYPLVIGGHADLAPAINQPLLCVILLDYGIVWDGATGFALFSFSSGESTMGEDGQMMLVMPYCDSFVIDCMDRKKFFDRRVINDFIKTI